MIIRFKINIKPYYYQGRVLELCKSLLDSLIILKDLLGSSFSLYINYYFMIIDVSDVLAQLVNSCIYGNRITKNKFAIVLILSF